MDKVRRLVPLEDRDYIIYLITNKINDKVYVGQTCKALEERWRLHCWNADYGTDNYFANAIRKYRPEAFVVEELCLVKGREEANRMEKFFISWYESIDRIKGYNSTTGGDGGWVFSEESRLKLSASQKALGRKMSPEQKRKLIEINSSRERTEEECRKISLSQRGLPTEEVHRLYLEEGLNTYEIAEKFGKTQSSVWNLLKYDKVPTRPNKGATLPQYRADLPNEEIKRLYEEENFSLVTLAEKFGVSKDTIKRHLVDSGSRIRSRIDGAKTSVKYPLLGTRAGDFEVVGKEPFRIKDKRYWLSQCIKCGYKQAFTTNQIKTGDVSKCGVYHKKKAPLSAYWEEPISA